MDYSFSLVFGIGGIGVLWRAVIAVIILCIMKYFDRDNPEYTKALKWLAIGGVLCVVAWVLLWGVFAGLMGAFFTSPLLYW